jgi:hypothetical protein
MRIFMGAVIALHSVEVAAAQDAPTQRDTVSVLEAVVAATRHATIRQDSINA